MLYYQDLGTHCENGMCRDDSSNDLPDDLSGKVVTVLASAAHEALKSCSLGHCFDKLTCNDCTQKNVLLFVSVLGEVQDDPYIYPAVRLLFFIGLHPIN